MCVGRWDCVYVCICVCVCVCVFVGCVCVSVCGVCVCKCLWGECVCVYGCVCVFVGCVCVFVGCVCVSVCVCERKRDTLSVWLFLLRGQFLLESILLMCLSLWAIIHSIKPIFSSPWEVCFEILWNDKKKRFHLFYHGLWNGDLTSNPSAECLPRARRLAATPWS